MPYRTIVSLSLLCSAEHVVFAEARLCFACSCALGVGPSATFQAACHGRTRFRRTTADGHPFETPPPPPPPPPLLSLRRCQPGPETYHLVFVFPAVFFDLLTAPSLPQPRAAGYLLGVTSPCPYHHGVHAALQTWIPIRPGGKPSSAS
ncbi:hypothetical protein LX36DRAFT_349861 [Colletotrichum falcatum]|nr:hypothetical protein LX36DRAFT_349861 [Colletotrichum falcatum]